MIRSTNADDPGGNLYASPKQAGQAVEDAKAVRPNESGGIAKAEDKAKSASAFIRLIEPVVTGSAASETIALSSKGFGFLIARKTKKYMHN